MSLGGMLILCLCTLQIAEASQYSPDLVLGAGVFNGPEGVAVDPNSDALFVVDTNNNRILRFNNRGSLIPGSPPDFVFGQNSTSATVNASTSQFTLTGPHSAWVDSAGFLWVADSGSNRVVWFLANASVLPVNVTGVLGQTTFAAHRANQGSTTPARNSMYQPAGVTVDLNGTLWVSDTNNNRYSPCHFPHLA